MINFIEKKKLFKDKYPKKENVPNKRKNKLLKKTISNDAVNCSKTI